MAQLKKSDQREIGTSGTVINSGVITGEEYKADLTGLSAIKTYDRMRRSDSTVRQALWALKQLILGADYGIDPVSDESKDQQIFEVVDASFKGIKWKKVLYEILTQLEFGYSLFEMVFEPRVINGQPRIVLTKLGFRKQTTITAWTMENGAPGVTQRTGDGKTFNMPHYKLARFTIQQEGDNYEGVSLLRTAYKDWYMKDKLERIDVIGHERHAVGVLDVAYPDNWKEATHKKEITAARKAAKNLRANPSSYVDHPKSVEFNFLNQGAAQGRDINPSIDRHDRGILRNVLAQFLELGSSGSGGSRAVSEDHSKLFEKSVQTVADDIVAVFNDVVVKTIVDLNFSDVTDYPKLRVGKISDDDMKLMSQALKLFKEAGVFHGTPADEQAIRKMSNLPVPETEDLQELFDKAPQPKPPAEKSVAASARRQLQAQVSARDFPDLYDGTGVDPDNLGCIMADVETLPIMKYIVPEIAGDLTPPTDDGDHQRGAVAEREAHVTLLYGLLENGNVWKDKVDALLDGWSMDTVTIRDVGYFEMPDGFAIVAHVDLTPELLDGHERLTLLPHIQTFSEYKPHITLAYVEKTADIDDWVDSLGNAYNGKTVKVTGINYGDKPEDKRASALKAAVAARDQLTEVLYGQPRAAA